jgi:hypothetical protein
VDVYCSLGPGREFPESQLQRGRGFLLFILTPVSKKKITDVYLRKLNPQFICQWTLEVTEIRGSHESGLHDHISGFIRRGRDQACTLALSCCAPLCYDATGRASPGQHRAPRLPSFQKRELNKLPFFSNFSVWIFCYSNRKQAKISLTSFGLGGPAREEWKVKPSTPPKFSPVAPKLITIFFF